MPNSTNEKLISLHQAIKQPLQGITKQHNVIKIDKSAFGKDANARLNHNLYGLARSYAEAKDVSIQLSKLGYFMVSHENGVSTFYNYSDKSLYDQILLPKLYTRFKSIYYSIEWPQAGIKPSRVLVIFSSVADLPYNADIERRLIFKNFKTIAKYIPYDTAIVRISDIGGIVGSFYLNNYFSMDLEDSIQTLLKDLGNLTGVGHEDIVLYGVSKGGTGALYHGLVGDYKFAAVDPIVSDDHHERKHNDSHFTIDAFPPQKV